MAIQPRQIGGRQTAVKEFVGRAEPRAAFWKRYDQMIRDGTTLINFYGAGGVGKSRLLIQLVNEIDQKKKNYSEIFKNIHVLYHDFVNGTDKRAILNRWKNELEKVGCEFPYFETGDFYLSLKQGAKNIDKPKMKSWLEKNKWLKFVKDELNNASNFSDAAIPGLNAAAELADVTNDALSIFPGIKSITVLVGAIDRILAERDLVKKLEEHSILREELNRRLVARNSSELEEYLPMLFAQDVCDWADNAAKPQKFIIFLDTYELLTTEGSIGTELASNNTYSDWWLRDDAMGHEGLIFTMPSTLWVIAGRNKLNWQGEFNKNLEQYLLKMLSDDDANKFLERAGIDNQQLRNEIAKFTNGYPLYLDACVDVYDKYIIKNSMEPPADYIIEQSNQVLIERILKYLDTDARTMIMCLSVIGKWTDNIAHNVVENFNPHTYMRVKNFAYIETMIIELDGNTKEIYQLVKTLQDILLKFIDNNKELGNLKNDTIAAMTKFAEILDEQNQSQEADILRQQLLNHNFLA